MWWCCQSPCREHGSFIGNNGSSTRRVGPPALPTTAFLRLRRGPATANGTWDVAEGRTGKGAPAEVRGGRTGADTPALPHGQVDVVAITTQRSVGPTDLSRVFVVTKFTIRQHVLRWPDFPLLPWLSVNCRDFSALLPQLFNIATTVQHYDGQPLLWLL